MPSLIAAPVWLMALFTGSLVCTATALGLIVGFVPQPLIPMYLIGRLSFELLLKGLCWVGIALSLCLPDPWTGVVRAPTFLLFSLVFIGSFVSLAVVVDWFGSATDVFALCAVVYALLILSPVFLIGFIGAFIYVNEKERRDEAIV